MRGDAPAAAPSCTRPSLQVGYELDEDELAGATSSGFDPEAGGMAKKSSRAMPGVGPAPAPAPAVKVGLSRPSNGTNGDAMAPVTPTRAVAAA